MQEGDVLIAPDGFAETFDMDDAPVVELRRELHCNAACFLAEYVTEREAP